MKVLLKTRMTLLGSAAVVALACASGISARATTDSANASARPATASAVRSKAGSIAPSPAAKKTTRKRRVVAQRTPVQKAPTPDRISEIQTALARAGYFQGDPTSKWDADTIAAMQKFQSANGLDSSGKLDALSLQKLGLGSAIAGVSAPTLPPTQHAPALRGSASSSLGPAATAPASSLAASAPASTLSDAGTATTATNALPPESPAR